MVSPAQITTAPADDTNVIASAYLTAAGGDAVLALRRAIADAPADLCEAERRTRARERVVSHGFVRGRLGAA